MYKNNFSQPQMIGSYRVLKHLGSGGLGDVYKVSNAWGEEFALKQLRDSTWREDFRREISVISSLKNEENIVDIYYYDLGNRPYYVMEYFPLKSLQNFPQFSEKDAINVLLQITKGLNGLHRIGGFHRDVKPSNILVKIAPNAQELLYVLADFGFARIPNNVSLMTRTAKGTPEYMAPEVLNGAPVSAKSDIYSLGITGFEILKSDRTRWPKLFGASIRLNNLLLQMTAENPYARPTLIEIRQELDCILCEKQNRNILSSANWSWGEVGIIAGSVLIGLLATGKKA